MKPGNELDEMIANIVYPNWREDFGKPDWSDLPGYSTDIGAAWEAWEWLEKRHPWSEVALGRNSEGLPSVLFLTQIDEGIWIIYNTVSADTLPAAICLAVLGTLTKAQ